MNVKRKIAWLIIGGVVIVGLISSNFANKYESAGSSSFWQNAGTAKNISEKTLSGSGRDKIAVIRIDGQIVDSTAKSSSILSGGSGASAEDVVKQIDQAENDTAVKALVLQINSPGGSAVAGQTILTRLEKFKNSGKKLYVAMREVAASAAYEISLPADKIYANPETETGSIGVIMEMTNYQGLYDKLGLKDVVIKSGDKKDIGNPDRPMTDDEQVILQTIVNSSYENFVAAVAKWRKMDPATVAGLADGRIYSGEQAHDYGLIDKLGNLPDVIDAAKSDIGLKEALVVEYQPSALGNILSDLLQKTSLPDQFADLLGQPKSQNSYQLMHLWVP